MDFGMVLPNAGDLAYPEAMVTIAERAEALGFSTLWTADHIVLPVESGTTSPYAKKTPDPELPIIDPMIALAAVASRTKKIRLGTSVYLSSLRHPIVSAKLIASLDYISNGRVLLGVGAGWIPEEYKTMGIDFAGRGHLLDENIQALRALLEQKRPAFAGKHYQFDNMGFEPKPVQSPLPIWVGGNTVAGRRRSARYGDGWHVIDVPAHQLAEGIVDLRNRCEAIGRNPDGVVVSTRSTIKLSNKVTKLADRPAPLVGPASMILEEISKLADIGVSHIGLWPGREKLNLPAYLDRMELLAETILQQQR